MFLRFVAKTSTALVHKDTEERKLTENIVLEEVFYSIYYLIKEEISNEKLLSLLDLMELLGVDNLKYFQTRSRSTLREMFLTLGDSIKDLMLQHVKKCATYGILTDEATDISVKEQLITFVQYVDLESGTPQTDFLSIDELEDPKGPCAEVITNKLLLMLNTCQLTVQRLGSIVSDGASVMLGRHNGVAARLKEINHTLINFHCICHRLALACGASGDQVQEIRIVEENLNQAWRFFDNSPKRTNMYLDSAGIGQYHAW